MSGTNVDPIAFLGAGNMAAAMVDGILARGPWTAAQIACIGGGGPSAAALAHRTGIRKAGSLQDAVAGTRTVVLTFKPQHLAQGGAALASATKGRLVVSVLAGRRLAALQSAAPEAANLVRFMPNTPAQLGAGITGWCAARPLDANDQATVRALLGALGKSVEVPEAQMDALTAVSGSGPAYVFEFAAALRDAGVGAGLPPEIAMTLAIETLLGAARLLAHRGVDPETLRNQVTSPNGTTAAGLRRMTERDFRGLMGEVVLAAKARSEELST
jgi:pyrroline-5-carboxylate reductase